MSTLRLIAALIVAAIYQLWLMAKGTVIAINYARKAHHPQAKERMEFCRECPFFYKPLQTCGSPLKKDLRNVGCHCSMEAKVKTKCNCWRYDTTDGKYGWPVHLNDFPLR